jgi:hypothetical protein
MPAAGFACVLLQAAHLNQRQQRCQEQHSKAGRCVCQLQHQLCLQASVQCQQQPPELQHILLNRQSIQRRQALMTQALPRCPNSAPLCMWGQLPLVQLSSSGRKAGNPCWIQQEQRLAALLLQQQTQQQQQQKKMMMQH